MNRIEPKVGEIDIPKGKDAEFVPIAKALAEFLRALPGEKDPESFVCPGKEEECLTTTSSTMDLLDCVKRQVYEE